MGEIPRALAYGQAGVVLPDNDPKHQLQVPYIMVICPYKAQVKRTIERLTANGVPYHRYLMVDAAQGSESNVVLFMLTKPATTSAAQVGFVNDYRRLKDILKGDDQYCNLLAQRARQLMTEQELENAVLETAFARLDLIEQRAAVALAKRASEIRASLERGASKLRLSSFLN